MSPFNNKNRLDNFSGIGRDDLNEVMNAKKSPWYLRWPAAAVLRTLGRLASKAVSLASAIIQPVRQRLNQWNWCKKTALVTALAITAAGTFVYQYRANAAAIAWPGVIASAGTKEFLVKLFVSIGVSPGGQFCA